jgi:hypothetical protein
MVRSAGHHKRGIGRPPPERCGQPAVILAGRPRDGRAMQGRSISAARIERTAHPIPSGGVSAGQGGLWSGTGSNCRPSAFQVNCAERCADLRKRTSLTSETALGGRCNVHASRTRCTRPPGGIATPPRTTATVVGVIMRPPSRCAAVAREICSPTSGHRPHSRKPATLWGKPATLWGAPPTGPPESRRVPAGQRSKDRRGRAVRHLPLPRGRRRRRRDPRPHDRPAQGAHRRNGRAHQLAKEMRAELRGVISTKPGLNRHLRVTRRPGRHRREHVRRHLAGAAP